MDDWYVTRALLNGSAPLYFDLGGHYLSVESGAVPSPPLNRSRTSQKLLFAHFRPASEQVH